MIAAPALVHAQTPAPATTPSDVRGARIDQRQANQDKRIDQGVKSGQLTQREAARLDKGQAHVNKMENKALADGKITKQEGRRIEHAQDVQSARIYRQKHDKQTAK
jgi:polyhydroxyalkanoate synthesis regulator phasin